MVCYADYSCLGRIMLITDRNFFLYEAILIPFEISALNLVLTYWSDEIPAAAIIVGCIV